MATVTDITVFHDVNETRFSIDVSHIEVADGRRSIRADVLPPQARTDLIAWLQSPDKVVE